MPERSKYLAEYLFNPAVKSTAIEEAMQATIRLMSDPDNEEAGEKLNKMLDKVLAAVEANMFGPSPRLTDEEND